MESQHKHKIGTEMSRYQALLQEKGDLNRQWDEDNQALVDRYFIHTAYSYCYHYTMLYMMHCDVLHCTAVSAC
jgi:hypothetical protein